MEKNQKIVLSLFIVYIFFDILLSILVLGSFTILEDILLLIFNGVFILNLIAGIFYSVKTIIQGEKFFGISFIIFFLSILIGNIIPLLFLF